MAFGIDDFDSESREEALRDSVVPAVALAARACDPAVLVQRIAVVLAFKEPAGRVAMLRTR